MFKYHETPLVDGQADQRLPQRRAVARRGQNNQIEFVRVLVFFNRGNLERAGDRRSSNARHSESRGAKHSSRIRRPSREPDRFLGVERASCHRSSQRANTDDQCPNAAVLTHAPDIGISVFFAQRRLSLRKQVASSRRPHCCRRHQNLGRAGHRPLQILESYCYSSRIARKQRSGR
jgi:hypothetical protein